MEKEKTILIVDDVEINRVILAEIFRDNYNIVEACNGLQAIEIIHSGKYIYRLREGVSG